MGKGFLNGDGYVVGAGVAGVSQGAFRMAGES